LKISSGDRSESAWRADALLALLKKCAEIDNPVQYQTIKDRTATGARTFYTKATGTIEEACSAKRGCLGNRKTHGRPSRSRSIFP
jgi:hypothetical protein